MENVHEDVTPAPRGQPHGDPGAHNPSRPARPARSRREGQGGDAFCRGPRVRGSTASGTSDQRKNDAITSRRTEWPFQSEWGDPALGGAHSQMLLPVPV